MHTQTKSRPHTHTHLCQNCDHKDIQCISAILSISFFWWRVILTGGQRHRWAGHLSVMDCDWHDCCVVSPSSLCSAVIFLLLILQQPTSFRIAVFLRCHSSRCMNRGRKNEKKDASYFHSHLMWRMSGSSGWSEGTGQGRRGNTSCRLFCRVQPDAIVRGWKRAVSHGG